MTLPIVLQIMFFTGIFGGILNWALQGNPGRVVTAQPLGKCILIGIGATILIPLFLEIAQSRLLDNIYNSQELNAVSVSSRFDTKTDVDSKTDKKDKEPLSKPNPIKNNTKDIAGNAKRKGDSLALETKKAKVKAAEARTAEEARLKKEEEQSGSKKYLLYTAYCLLAAAAGPRFINGLLDGVLKDKKISTLTKEKKVITAEKDKAVEEKEKVVEEKDEIEKVKIKLAAQNHLAAKKDEENALRAVSENAIVDMAKEGTLEGAGVAESIDYLKAFKPGPIIHPDDPQKGRFGGKSEHNGRALRAIVGEENFYGFFQVTIWVESTNSQEPLQDVLFFLHDSFRPSVYLIKKEELKEGKIMDRFEAYGAFTIGAVTDNGKTLLELDLAEQIEFPKEFRQR